MRLTIEIESDPAKDKVDLTIRKAEGDSKAKTILTFPFDRETARTLIHDELEAALAVPGAAIRARS